jgi:pyridoxine kinase
MNSMYKAMTIAGSDTSGGAGMEADLKTFQEMGVYGMTALTCIVAQNPHKEWAHEIYPIELDVIEKQISTICDGIGCDAMKTGMLGSADLVELVAKTIDRCHLKNVVIDPVMVCKGIETIMVPEAAAAIKKVLVKRADVITPNTIEAAYLADMPKVKSLEDMKEAAGRIKELGAKYVIMKAGDRFAGAEALDIIYDGKEFTINKHPKITNCFNQGAGCTFSAGITAGLAKGLSVKDALLATEKFISAALQGSFRLNKYSGATKHCAWRSK